MCGRAILKVGEGQN